METLAGTNGRLFYPGQWLDSQEEILRHPASEIMRTHKPEKVFAAAREMMRAAIPGSAG